eukprot:Gb_41058 [translate_table: standard]
MTSIWLLVCSNRFTSSLVGRRYATMQQSSASLMFNFSVATNLSTGVPFSPTAIYTPPLGSPVTVDPHIPTKVAQRFAHAFQGMPVAISNTGSPRFLHSSYANSINLDLHHSYHSQTPTTSPTYG